MMKQFLVICCIGVSTLHAAAAVWRKSQEEDALFAKRATYLSQNRATTLEAEHDEALATGLFFIRTILTGSRA